jgi:tetratricopeptide (TPR) repeat protein
MSAERIEELTDRAINAMNEQEWDEAIEAFGEAAHLAPKDWRFPNEAGLCHLRLEQFSEAEQAFRRAFELAPGDQHSSVLSNLALALTLGGKDDESIEVHRRVLKNDPGYFKSHAELGALMRKRGKGKEALGHLDIAVEGVRDQGDDDPHKMHHLSLLLLNRARVHLFLLDDEDAGLEEVEALIDETRNLGRAWTLANELVHAEKWTSARAVLEMIVEEDPNADEPRALLETVEEHI